MEQHIVPFDTIFAWLHFTFWARPKDDYYRIPKKKINKKVIADLERLHFAGLVTSLNYVFSIGTLTFMFDLLKVAPMSGVFIARQLSGFATPLRFTPTFYPRGDTERERERASTLLASDLSAAPLTPFFISSLAAGVAPLSRKRTRDGRIILRRHVRSILSAKNFREADPSEEGRRSCARIPRRNINSPRAALSGYRRAKRVSLLNIIAV